MQQLNLFEPPPAEHGAPVWTTLDAHQQAAAVTKLAEMIAKTVVPADRKTDDE